MAGSRGLIVAIDGPAGSGKSTTARLLARRLGYLHIDTGAMYRAMTLKVIRAGIDPSDHEGISHLADETEIRLVSCQVTNVDTESDAGLGRQGAATRHSGGYGEEAQHSRSGFGAARMRRLSRDRALVS